MTGQTHLYCGVATAGVITVATGLFGIEQSGIMAFAGWITGAAFGSLLPDVDKSGSKINHIFPFAIISFLIRILGAKHRGVTHSLLFLLMISVVSGVLIATGIPVLIGFGCGTVIGDATHLLLDSLNGKGCQLLYPLKPNKPLADIKYDGFVEKSIRLSCFVISSMAIFLSIRYR